MGIIDRIRAYAGQGGSDAERAGGPSDSAAPSSQRSPLELRIIKELQGALAQDGGAPVRYRFLFTGNVQGVGFRYTAKYAASSLELTGWARNEYDGTVTMEVQGREPMINKLLMRLNHDRFISIEWMDAKEIPLRDDEHGFTVR